MVLLLPFLMNTSMGAFVGWARAFRNQSASSACQEASAGSQWPLVLVIVFGSSGSCILLLLNVPRIHISAFMPVDKNTILNLECSFVFFFFKNNSLHLKWAPPGFHFLLEGHPHRPPPSPGAAARWRGYSSLVVQWPLRVTLYINLTGTKCILALVVVSRLPRSDSFFCCMMKKRGEKNKRSVFDSFCKAVATSGSAPNQAVFFSSFYTSYVIWLITYGSCSCHSLAGSAAYICNLTGRRQQMENTRFNGTDVNKQGVWQNSRTGKMMDVTVSWCGCVK